MLLEIVKYGHPVLRKKGTVITVFDESLTKLASNMLETMYTADGIGLAAQQVGLATRLFVIDVPEDREEEGEEVSELLLAMPFAMVNPEILNVEGEPEVELEGCLSFPEVFAKVKREPVVTVRYQDLKGDTHELTTGGLLGRCIQHEFDHIEGILFIDHVSEVKRISIAGKLKRLKKETEASLGIG